MKKQTKFLALALALMMLFTALPLFAFAESGTGTADTSTTAPQATGDIVTEYGTISAEDAAGKQAALFYKKSTDANYTLKGCYTNFCISGNSATNDAAIDVAYAGWDTTGDGKADIGLHKKGYDFVFYLLKSVEMTKKTFVAPDNHAGNTVTIDLGGHTFTSTQSIITFNTNSSASGHDKFIFKNGTISYTQWVVYLYYNSGSKGSGGDFTFDNIKFTDNSTTEANGYIVATKHQAVPSQTLTSNIVFKNCEIEASTTLKNKYLSLNEYTTETGKEVSAGIYTKITIDCDHNAANADGDKCLICGAVIEQTPDTTPDLVTDYGTIPGEYTDASTYPIAVFVNGAYAKSFATWSNGKQPTSEATAQEATAALDYTYYYLSRTDSDVVVYLLADIETSRSFGNADNYRGNTVTVDLDDHKIIHTATLLYFNSNQSAKEIDNFIFKNGSIEFGKNHLFRFVSQSDSASSGVNITCENINFIHTGTDKKIVEFALTNPNNADPLMECQVTFRNCTVTGEETNYIVGSSYEDYTVVGGKNGIYVNIDCDHNDADDEKYCKLCGKYAPVALSGYSTTLGSTLGINFYAELPANVKTVEISVAAKNPQSFTVADMLKQTDGEYAGHYKFSSSVSSINIRENIVIRFLDADGNAVEIKTPTGKNTYIAYTTSVFEYANSILNDAKYGAAAEALLNYGAYAEIYFGKVYEGEHSYNVTSLEKVSALANSAVTGTVSASAGQTILGRVQLDLDNTTTIRIFINAAAIEVTNANTAVDIFEGYVEIQDVDAVNLDTVYTFTVNGVDVAISATGVARYAVNTSTNQNAVNLMKALYLFSEAVKGL